MTYFLLFGVFFPQNAEIWGGEWRPINETLYSRRLRNSALCCLFFWHRIDGRLWGSWARLWSQLSAAVTDACRTMKTCSKWAGEGFQPFSTRRARCVRGGSHFSWGCKNPSFFFLPFLPALKELGNLSERVRAPITRWLGETVSRHSRGVIASRAFRKLCSRQYGGRSS